MRNPQPEHVCIQTVFSSIQGCQLQIDYHGQSQPETTRDARHEPLMHLCFAGLPSAASSIIPNQRSGEPHWRPCMNPEAGGSRPSKLEARLVLSVFTTPSLNPAPSCVIPASPSSSSPRYLLPLPQPLLRDSQPPAAVAHYTTALARTRPPLRPDLSTCGHWPVPVQPAICDAVDLCCRCRVIQLSNR